MWTGQRLYEGIPKEKVFMVKVEPGHDPVTRVRSERPELSPAEWAFLERALACEPKDRFASAADMLSAWHRLGDTCIVPPVSTQSTMDALVPDGTEAYAEEEPTAKVETPVPPPAVRDMSTGLSAARGSRGPLFWLFLVTAALLLAAGGLFMFGKKKTTSPEAPAVTPKPAAVADIAVPGPADVVAAPAVAAGGELVVAPEVDRRLEVAGLPDVRAEAEVTAGDVSEDADIARQPDAREVLEVAGPPEVAAPEPVKVTVNSEPPGATVWRGGENLGRAPVQVDVMPAQTVRLTLKLKGHVNERVKVRAGDGARKVRLEKRPPPPEEDGDVKILVDSAPPREC